MDPTSAARPRPDVRALRLQRLAQIRTRDPGAEGRFWYSVVTTGVYCRPTCPSRRARPENISLHDTLAEARATGFRPCRRCRPESPSLNGLHRSRVEAACRMIETEPGLPASRIAAALGLSLSQFYRLFRRHTGTTPSAWAEERPAPEARAPDPDSGTPAALARSGMERPPDHPPSRRSKADGSGESRHGPAAAATARSGGGTLGR